jgi:hypothetical protein
VNEDFKFELLTVAIGLLVVAILALLGWPGDGDETGTSESTSAGTGFVPSGRRVLRDWDAASGRGCLNGGW